MPASSARAVIWDMDGVIADTGGLHFRAWQAVFAERGIDFTEDDFRRTFGQRNDNIIRSVMGENVPDEEMQAISEEKEEKFRAEARQHVAAFPGVISLMQSLREKGFRMAVASSAPLANLELLMEKLNTGKYMDAVVSAEDVARGKPDPQIFLLAAERLGVPPQDCVVIEDAVAGVAAAKRAGTRCIAVTNTHPREHLKEADLVVESLEQVSADRIERLLGLPNKK